MEGVTILNKTPKVSLCGISILLFILLVIVPVFQKFKELYYVNVIGLNEKAVRNKHLDSTTVQLPVGYALLFVDDASQYGYVYFDEIKYDKASYVLVIYKNGVKTEQNGNLTRWSCIPWKRLTIKDGSIFDGNEKFPHFSWTPHNGLGFSKSKILKVSLVPLAKARVLNYQTNNVDWLQVENVKY